MIGPNFGGVTSIIKNNETGFSFSSDSVNAHQELAFILKNIIDSKIPTDHLKVNAYNQIIKNHNMAQMIKALEMDF